MRGGCFQRVRLGALQRGPAWGVCAARRVLQRATAGYALRCRLQMRGAAAAAAAPCGVHVHLRMRVCACVQEQCYGGPFSPLAGLL